MKRSSKKPPRGTLMIRLTASEKFIIDQKAKRSGHSKSSYLRSLGIKGEVRTRFTIEEREMIRQLIEMSNDLHQLVLMSKQEGLLTTLLHFTEYRNKFDQVFNKLIYAK
jgi:hypothetical protein